MPRKVEIVARVEIDGYACEIGLTKEELEIAQKSPVSHPHLESQIDRSRKKICIQARKALLQAKPPRTDVWVDFDKLKIEVVRNVRN